jgi:hypothetical protein
VQQKRAHRIHLHHSLPRQAVLRPFPGYS